MGGRGRGSVPFPCINDIEAFLLGQRQYSQLLAVETSDGELGKVNRKPALIHWQQAHPLAPQHLTQRHIVLLPSNLPLMMHTAHQHPRRVLPPPHPPPFPPPHSPLH